MLKQILKDMYVDPEILAELPEEQKQMLFFKIREEQKRRYYEFDKKDGNKKEKKKTKSSKNCVKRIKISEDSNGMPWTWVMGDYPGDICAEDRWERMRLGLPLDEISTNKQPVAKVQALIHANAVKNSDVIIQNKSKIKTEVTKPPIPARRKIPTPARPEPPKHTERPPPIPEREIPPTVERKTQPIKRETTPPAPNRNDVEEIENESIYEDMSDIKRVNEAAGKKSEAEEAEWKQQLTRMKKEDERRRMIARRASMEVIRQSKFDAEKVRQIVNIRHRLHRQLKTDDKKPPLPPKPKNLRPIHPAPIKNKAKPECKSDVVSWFHETQLESIMQDNDDQVPDYLHGIISRQDANDLLNEKKEGDFLVRVSDKLWGFALSYKDEDRVKHFLIDACAPSTYHFFGNDQIRHSSLQELIEFHMEEPISYGKELLKVGVGQRDGASPDYSDVIPNVNSANISTSF